MKHIIRKAFWNYEKEEKWLNSLSAKGLAMTDYSWCRYVFEETLPGEYIYRIELLEKPAPHPESRQYIAFIEDTGAEFVASYMRWAYFRKKAEDGPFELFTDIDSRLIHSRRVRALWAACAAAEFAIMGANFAVGFMPPVSELNLILAAAICPFFIMFAYLAAHQSRRVKELKRRRKITEG